MTAPAPSRKPTATARPTLTGTVRVTKVDGRVETYELDGDQIRRVS